MKRLAILILTVVTLMLPVTVNAKSFMIQYDGEVQEYTGSVYSLKVNGKTVNTPLEPIIFNDRALVPIREVFEAIGASVNYEDSTKRITVRTDSVTVKLQINNNSAYVNDNMVAIPDGVVPKLIGRVGESAKTMVPVRFISESIGMNVEFDGDNGIININTPNFTQQPTVTPNEGKIKISGIEFKETAEGVDIIAKTNSIASVTDSILSDPYRIVIDVDGAMLTAETSAYSVDKKGVARVRLGQHENSTRIVVDMQSKLNYRIETANDGIFIHIATAAVSTPSQTPDSSPSVSPSVQQTKKLVVLDAGHGGHDPGASGVDVNGVKHSEKTVALSIVHKVRNILKANGVEVMLTREDDTFVDLYGRPEIANNANAAMFVSVHLNAVDNSTVMGTEVYYATANNGTDYGLTSKELAGNVLQTLLESIQTRNRKVKTGNHVVTRASKMPAILIEVGFMTNPTEMTNLADDAFQEKAAQGIANGILKSISSVNVPQVQSDGIEYMTD